MLFQTFVEHKQRYFEECGFIDAILIGVRLNEVKYYEVSSK